MKRLVSVAMFAFCALVWWGLMMAASPSPEAQKPAPARRFEFSYSFAVKDLPPGDHVVRVWIPLASSDAHQTVTVRKITSPVPTKTMRESEYGDRMLYAEMRHTDGPATFTIDYAVTRKEYSRGNFAALARLEKASADFPRSVHRFLLPDQLVPINEKLGHIAEQETAGKQDELAKAYALYDYVFHTMRYDKSGTGWGHGDAMWACDAKHGNCTDFHSLFIALARSQHIPARFEIGFPLPENAHEGEIPGYHCWAEFYLSGLGWVPVDISEAWKAPAKHDYFFGSLDTNRVQFTMGRDLTLEPKQSGPTLNYFVYPYVEVDGKPYDQIDKKFAFRDEPAGTAATGRSAGL
jgi:transglutaminase-like putative cysteine protease